MKSSKNQARLIDDEWNDFISYSNNSNTVDSDDEMVVENAINKDGELCDIENTNTNANTNIINKVSDIYISTKTIIAYLNVAIDLNTIFWKIPVIPYSYPTDGVIKNK